MQNIEGAAGSDGGNFASASIAPFALPPIVSSWLGTFCVNTAERILALTYDDGPHPIHTPLILDALSARGATATFFVLAAQVKLYPEIARRIVEDGHEVALHGIDHRSLRTMSPREGADKVRRAKEYVESIVGTRIRLYRPPYGEYRLQDAIRLMRLGLELVMWSDDSRDWEGGGKEVIAARSVSGAFPGSILLLHDNRGDPETLPTPDEPDDYDRVGLLENVLDLLDEGGYQAVGVSDMFDSYQRVRSIARYSRMGERNGDLSKDMK
ncbi:polysaccharide deacetylase family protein [Planctomonas sp. JC2975]|uniref:polysaccharide deacetylase family protein n=1 Tax=Planctomonas sp. JC2975 TaxID=2729626 RepID=UPI001474092B|nr:polysaccharide deacetylase family protein [Planctomonas sp. JC2975]NNC11881.1 polysaccharide deacetylase family protein [Planctomonas sp. JC2975]